MLWLLLTALAAQADGAGSIAPTPIAEGVQGWHASVDGEVLIYRDANGLRLHLPARGRTIEVEPEGDRNQRQLSAALLDANTLAWALGLPAPGGALSGRRLTVQRLPDGPARTIHPGWGSFVPLGRTGGDDPRLLLLVQPARRGADANVLAIEPQTLASSLLATLPAPGTIHTHRLSEDGRSLTIWSDPPREEMTPAKHYEPAERHDVRCWTIDPASGEVGVERREGKDMPPPANAPGRAGRQARPAEFPLIGRKGKVTYTGNGLLIERFGVTGSMFGGEVVHTLIPGPQETPRRLACDLGSGDERAVWIIDLKTASSLKLRDIGPLDSLKGYGPEGRYLVYEHFSGERTGEAANGTLVVHDHRTRTDMTIHPRGRAKYVNYVGFAGPGWLVVSANQWHDGAIRATVLGLIDLPSGDATIRPILTGKLLKWHQVGGALIVSDYDGPTGTYTLYRVDPPQRSNPAQPSEDE
jgi:hypothetical protein